ncbi:MAG: endolytic transglycosylase MltG [Armatimonadetes bacterium]|nr:endolytic transglycosylase MltG [Armatimonadota bacterium]
MTPPIEPEQQATNPPAKRFPVALTVAIVLTVLLVGGAGGSQLYLRWARSPMEKRSFSNASVGKPVRVAVPTGASVETVARDLEAKRLIRSAKVFVLGAKGATIAPGVYDFSPTESPAQIVSRLQKGDVVTVRVTFPEGFRLTQIAKRLAKNGLCDETKFLELVTTRGDTLKADFPLPKKLEGYLFPDTYRFPLGDTETQIAQRMLDNFDRVFAEPNKGEIARSGRSLSDIVTVAAMVEREARVQPDRPTIAGVIYNRLQRGMRLQIDATVQYALPEHKARLLFKDLETDSPYNTYKNVGLPMGAICCPGKPSLDAALRPGAHPFLFYVARQDGSHVFGKTFAEHTRNIAAERGAR